MLLLLDQLLLLCLHLLQCEVLLQCANTNAILVLQLPDNVAFCSGEERVDLLKATIFEGLVEAGISLPIRLVDDLSKELVLSSKDYLHEFNNELERLDIALHCAHM